MTRIVLVGSSGRMGRTVAQCASCTPGIDIVAGVDVRTDESSADAQFPLYSSLQHVNTKADVLIDFSRPDSLESILTFCAHHKCGAVLATTGYTDVQTAEISKASQDIPIFQAPNFSIGVALLYELVKHAASVLDAQYDIEIVERHHRSKRDAPSGTALGLADAIRTVHPTLYNVYGRFGPDMRRQNEEIGVHAVRGGSLVGEHEVMFLSNGEELDIAHRAYSKDVFAQGALKAAEFIADKECGMYTMHNLLEALGLRQRTPSEPTPDSP